MAFPFSSAVMAECSCRTLLPSRAALHPRIPGGLEDLGFVWRRSCVFLLWVLDPEEGSHNTHYSKGKRAPFARALPVAFCFFLFSSIFSGKWHVSHIVNQFGPRCFLNWNFPNVRTLRRKYSWKQETVGRIAQLLRLKQGAVMEETALLMLWSIALLTAQATFPALFSERKPDSPCNHRTHPHLLQVCTHSVTHWHTVIVPWHSNTL